VNGSALLFVIFPQQSHSVELIFPFREMSIHERRLSALNFAEFFFLLPIKSSLLDSLSAAGLANLKSITVEIMRSKKVWTNFKFHSGEITYILRPSQHVGEMIDSRRCSSADSENMREKNYKHLFAAGRSVKNVPRH